MPCAPFEPGGHACYGAPCASSAHKGVQSASSLSPDLLGSARMGAHVGQVPKLIRKQRARLCPSCALCPEPRDYVSLDAAPHIKHLSGLHLCTKWSGWLKATGRTRSTAAP